MIDAVHFSDFQPWATADEINESSGSRLEKDIRQALSCASNRVISAILTGSTEELYFSSGLTEDHLVRGSFSDIQEVCGSFDSLYLDNQTTPKCFISEVVRRFTVIGALGSAPTNTETISPGQPLCHTDEFVMVRTSMHSGKSGSLTQIASIPQVATRKACSQINAKWYMLWQVVFPALSFAHRYIPSLQESVIAHVCSEMNLEREWVFFALEKGIQQTPTELLSNVCVPKKEIVFDEVSALVCHQASPHETGIEGKKRKRKDTLNKIPSRKVRRSQVDEALGGHRPVGSGRTSIPDEQRRECQDLRTADKRRKKSGTTHDCRPQANLVWSGEPDEQFYPFNKEPINWPPGWKKQVFQRASGGTQGATDRYWYTPKQSYKLRSLKEVYNFFACMERNENDETRAWKALKKK